MERGRTGRVLSLDIASGSVRRDRLRAVVRVRRVRRRRGRPGQRKLASPPDRYRRGWKPARRPRQSAGLSVSAFSGGVGWFLAHGVRRAHPARRIRAARKCLPAPHDDGDRPGILDRAQTEIRPVVSRTDAGRPYQDHGRRQALGAAAVLRPCHPARCQRGCRSTPCIAGSTASTMAWWRRSRIDGSLFALAKGPGRLLRSAAAA